MSVGACRNRGDYHGCTAMHKCSVVDRAGNRALLYLIILWCIDLQCRRLVHRFAVQAFSASVAVQIVDCVLVWKYWPGEREKPYHYSNSIWRDRALRKVLWKCPGKVRGKSKSKGLELGLCSYIHMSHKQNRVWACMLAKCIIRLSLCCWEV